jgi:hypothetical protein
MEVSAPLAPSLIALEKTTGRLFRELRCFVSEHANGL